jgi:hypothetical protein
MEPYEFADVLAGLEAHMKSSKFAPTPADVIDFINSRDRRPTADEAWSMIPRSEAESVYWTEEMAIAYAMAAPLLEHGDPIAARKAFNDRYGSEVQRARAQRRPIKVTPSLGWDLAGRTAALQKAVSIGLLTNDQARPHTEALGAPDLHGSIDFSLKRIK